MPARSARRCGTSAHSHTKSTQTRRWRASSKSFLMYVISGTEQKKIMSYKERKKEKQLMFLFSLFLTFGHCLLTASSLLSHAFRRLSLVFPTSFTSHQLWDEWKAFAAHWMPKCFTRRDQENEKSRCAPDPSGAKKRLEEKQKTEKERTLPH